jgi:hypothetical protein
MPYEKVDTLAINTIRTLAVCCVPRRLPRHCRQQLPRYRPIFPTSARSVEIANSCTEDFNC